MSVTDWVVANNDFTARRITFKRECLAIFESNNPALVASFVDTTGFAQNPVGIAVYCDMLDGLSALADTGRNHIVAAPDDCIAPRTPCLRSQRGAGCDCLPF